MLGIAEPDCSLVIKLRGQSGLYVLGASEGGWSSGNGGVGWFPNLAEAVHSVVAGGRIGIEETWLALGDAVALRDAGIDIHPISVLLSKWREYRDHDDVAFTVVLAEITRRALAAALDFAAAGLAAGQVCSELGVAERYAAHVQSASKELASPCGVSEFFFVGHAADRTVFPSKPTRHQVSAASGTLKLDAGLKLTMDGVVLATSDLARTLATTDRARDACELLTAALKTTMESALVVGRRFSEVHQDCLNVLSSSRDALEQLAFLHPDQQMELIYAKRNVGHLMGKQESFVSEFRPGDADVLREYAVGAIEIQWPSQAGAIGVEEMWALGPDGLVVLTSD
jgi:hypothetical protein